MTRASKGDVPSPLGRPVGASGEDTRQRIIEATMRCVAETGYSHATIREIAREARITSGSLYHYFPNKAELITATFLAMAEIVAPRLAGAADSGDGVISKLTAIFDEFERIHRDYPYAAGFDRAIRAESARHLHLEESSNSMFAALRNIVVDIVEEGPRTAALPPGVEVESAANAVFTLIRGLNDYAAYAASPEEYHATVHALKSLISGSLFAARPQRAGPGTHSASRS